MGSSERRGLIDYLRTGGSLYIEGSNFCSNNYEDPYLFPYFGVEFVRRGGIEEVFRLVGQTSTVTEGLDFAYGSGGVEGYDYRFQPDQIAPDGGVLLFIDEDYKGRVVANATDNCRTIVSTTILKGLVDSGGNNNKAYLMNQYLMFLDPLWDGFGKALIAENLD